MTADAGDPAQRMPEAGSPGLSVDADVVSVTVPKAYSRSYGEFVRFLRQQTPGVWIDWVAVKEAYRFGRGRPFPIGRRGNEAAMDEKAKVRFSADGLTAYLILYPPKPQGKRLAEAELLRLVRAYGIPPNLLDVQQVRLASLRRSYGEPEPIARGIAAVDGAEARIVWNEGLPSDPTGFLAAIADGETPYPARALATAVEGQAAGRYFPPGQGTAGLSAGGEAIAPRRGADPTRLGNGFELLSDGATIRATCSGHLRISGVGGSSAEVFPLLTAKTAQDLEQWAGGIYPGSLIVDGDLELRFPLRVLGDMEVRGGLVRSGVEVMGSLFVRDGIINSGRAPVRVGGVVSAAFLDRASVMADTVHLRRYALQSRIVAANAVVAVGNGVSIAGGLVHANQRIEACALGSPNAMETEAALGLPTTATAFQGLFQSWAEALLQAEAPSRETARHFAAAANRWRAAAQAVASPDIATAKIHAEKVHAGVTVRIGAALRQISSTFGPVVFAYEKIGDRDRVAMIRQ